MIWKLFKTFKCVGCFWYTKTYIYLHTQWSWSATIVGAVSYQACRLGLGFYSGVLILKWHWCAPTKPLGLATEKVSHSLESSSQPLVTNCQGSLTALQYWQSFVLIKCLLSAEWVRAGRRVLSRILLLVINRINPTQSEKKEDNPGWLIKHFN